MIFLIWLKIIFLFTYVNILSQMSYRLKKDNNSAAERYRSTSDLRVTFLSKRLTKIAPCNRSSYTAHAHCTMEIVNKLSHERILEKW